MALCGLRAFLLISRIVSSGLRQQSRHVVAMVVRGCRPNGYRACDGIGPVALLRSRSTAFPSWTPTSPANGTRLTEELRSVPAPHALARHHVSMSQLAPCRSPSNRLHSGDDTR